MIKAIIFDFFDVFRTDAYKAWLHANNIPHEGAYHEASRQQDLGNITTKEFLEKLSELRGHPVTLQDLEATTTVNNDVVAIAQTLKKKYRIALLSNAPSAFIRDLLTKLDLESLFDEIIISSEVGMVKPDAEIFELTMARLKVTATETIFIDDNPGHVQAAEMVGITGIQFLSAEQLQTELNALEKEQ